MDKTEIETYKRFLPALEAFEVEKTGRPGIR
jgi:hypothetical protein